MGKRTGTVSKDDRLKALATREAILGLYTGSIQPCDIPSRYPHISRRRATELATKLPQHLVDSATSLQLTRAVNSILGIETRGTYTTWELQQATAKYAAKNMSAAECTATYGVGGSTLRQKRKELKLPAGRTAISVANRAAKRLKLGKPGP